MHRIHLTPETATTEAAKRILALVTEHEKGPVTYTTIVRVGENEYRLVTTHKETHISFGSMGEEARQALCTFIRDELLSSGQSELMITVARENLPPGVFPPGLYVTPAASGDKQKIFHVSPSRM